eukprot:TRINITY_DN564_c0_g1_i2.p2 TRINITY_DN564_c0_g1~~TRINITY_DN564_c0_g1_i2.p2  ORF type:complete len:482 (+),score=81.35 TRINITY_DN564_c0_g1_i2:1653-3098(+)
MSRLTTATGNPVPDNQNTMSAGKDGPLLLQDVFFVEKMAHFDRERIPERVVHAKGAGAHGYFEVTHDVTRFTKAKFLNQIGKRTPLLARFSTVGGEKGSADAARDPRGFAVKFYTEEGNYDMVGNNTPVFFIRDPTKFPDFIHTQKRNPQTNLKDATMFWDFLSQTPESLHQLTVLFSDRGTPASYRHMNGYSSHTFKLCNNHGEYFYCKFHYKTESGIKNLTDEEATRLSGTDPDHATRDLFDHISKGGVAAWKVCMQVMPVEAAKTYKWDVLDITKIWPHKDYPLIPIGRMVLNRNPENYFAEIEQVAFSPGHLVPGIEPSEDKMLQGRLFSYPDTHRHRLGGNYHQIPVNCPYRTVVRNGQRDGFMVVNGNQGSAPNYEPNSFGGPTQDKSVSWHAAPLSGTVTQTPRAHPNSDYEQAGNLYRLMDKDARSRLVANIVGHLKDARHDIQVRQLKLFMRADPEYGSRIAQGLGVSLSAL